MPNQRPFFANFLAAFRAHSALKTTPSASSTSASITTSAVAATTSQHLPSPPPTQQTQPSSPTTSRAIPSKGPSSALSTAAVQAAFSPPSTHSHRHTTTTAPLARSPASPLGNYGQRNRRGSDSSNEGGFRDALGGEKWFIGGRTATGEERFYRLGVIKRERSGDRASCDRMSL